MNRLQSISEATRNGTKLLCPFLTAGYPSLEATTEFLLAAQSGGGAPKSAPRYASGVTYLGNPVADMRVDFTSPVTAFGMWIIDNDQSVGRLQAFGSDGTLLSTLVVPQVGANGSAFHGIDIGGSGSLISYVIYDGNNGSAIDSTFLDNLYFRPAVVPEPGTAALLFAGATLLGGVARRRARKH